MARRCNRILREGAELVRTDRVVVIGAGIAGLVAALELARKGLEVTVIERAAAPGGKMREIDIAGARIDAGPTVFTMRWVFEEIFDAAGASLSEAITLRPAELLARHAWGADERLDLFAARDRSADAIASFAGAQAAKGYRRFCEDAASIYRTLERPFIRAARPSLQGLISGAGLRDLWQIRPFATLWRALGDYFDDPRLRQLFGRYATYCGSSPFLAPATLMLVAHVEQEGVWLVEGGMHRLAAVLSTLAMRQGATIRYDVEATRIETGHGRVTAVRLATGERLETEAVLVNADVAALAAGHFGPELARAVSPVPRRLRSLSAVTWALLATTDGFPLARHTVFFSRDYAAEFDDIFRRQRVPGAPTVYVCAQDRDDLGHGPSGAERLLCLINAPPTGDTEPFPAAEIERCERATFGMLERCGLRVRRHPKRTVVTTPADFERLFPATGGALYGAASHGWRASFERQGAGSRLPGLYLAGGSTHPGPGVPMAALSGRMAAAALIADLASIGRSAGMATSGGMSTR